MDIISILNGTKRKQEELLSYIKGVQALGMDFCDIIVIPKQEDYNNGKYAPEEKENKEKELDICQEALMNLLFTSPLKIINLYYAFKDKPQELMSQVKGNSYRGRATQEQAYWVLTESPSLIQDIILSYVSNQKEFVEAIKAKDYNAFEIACGHNGGDTDAFYIVCGLWSECLFNIDVFRRYLSEPQIVEEATPELEEHYKSQANRFGFSVDIWNHIPNEYELAQEFKSKYTEYLSYGYTSGVIFDYVQEHIVPSFEATFKDIYSIYLHLPEPNAEHKEKIRDEVPQCRFLPQDIFTRSQDVRSIGTLQTKVLNGIKKAPYKFEDFIDELADKGYINNDLDTRLHFAQIFLTQKVSDRQGKIVWLKNEGLLFYIIREMFDENVSFYKAACEFFEGVQCSATNATHTLNNTKRVRAFVDDFIRDIKGTN